MEINKEQRESIRKKWGQGIQLYSNIKDAFKYNTSDIVIVATPTHTHLNIIQDIFNTYEPKLIICEKPLVTNNKEFTILKKLFNTKISKLLTNFPRRFDPSINKVYDFLQKNTNIIYHFNGTFPKGFIHNGSHMIDLISLLCGNIEDIRPIELQEKDNDYFGKFLVKTNNSSGIIANIDNNELSLFEFTMYTDCAKIEISGANQEISIHHVANSKKFKNYRSYAQIEKLPITLDMYGYNTLAYAIQILEDDQKYSLIKKQQEKVNTILFDTQTKLRKYFEET